MIPGFTVVPVDDESVSEIQRRLERTLRPVVGSAIVDGRQLDTDTIDTAAAGTRLVHGLGRTPAGWSVVDLDADANVWRVSWDSTSITLRASASVNAAVWVY